MCFYFILISIFFSFLLIHLFVFIYFCIACLVHCMHICKSFNWTYAPHFCLHRYNIQPLQHLFVYSIFHALDAYLHNMQRSIWTVCFLNEMQEAKRWPSASVSPASCCSAANAFPPSPIASSLNSLEKKSRTQRRVSEWIDFTAFI